MGATARFPLETCGYRLDVGRTHTFVDHDPVRRTEPPAAEPARTEEQTVASGQAPEAPAAVLFTVIAAIALVTLVPLGIAGLAYRLA